ncbi:hypothetical protein Lesp02_02560 [Lentzea sp. NBRC 105346]|uniref:helix-turn-helix domain-containing protein n=1 Tax=Lentzea sp. NBRC 105346 TaxID=3032205 RepID=UPI0024A43951|nr:helix-turn-helix domain-containing protein [Lentzea sp. NBRC 105346]GLZ28066.1 hypothetical protein Lesp02_02560 [Lentzea sp. NBRC 105346]
MSIKVMTWVWDHAHVSGTELLLMLAIADQANDRGTDAWPSIHDLARRTRLNERTVQRVIQRLQAGSHITVEAGGGRLRNRYTIIMSSTTNDPAPPVDNRAAPPAEHHPRQNATGGTDAASGVTQLRRPSPGTAVSPVPSYTVLSPTSVTVSPPETHDEGEGEADQSEKAADEVLRRISRHWRLSAADRNRLRPRLTAALSAGHQVSRLIAYLSENNEGARSPFAVLTSRLSELSNSAEPEEGSNRWPEWCGRCDGPEPHRRLIQLSDDQVMHCLLCHPKQTNTPDA